MARVTKAQMNAMAVRFLNARRAFGLDTEVERVGVSAGSEYYGNSTTITMYKNDHKIVRQECLSRSPSRAYDELRMATVALEDLRWDLDRKGRP